VFTEESRLWKFLIPTAVIGGAAAVILLFFLPLDRFKIGQSHGIREDKTGFFLNTNPEITDPIPETKTLSLNDRIAPGDFSTPNRIETEGVPPVPERIEESVKTDMIEEPVKTDMIEEPVKTDMIEETVPVVASVDTAVQEPRADLTPEPSYSTILGQITLKRKETLSRIIRQVYGGFNSNYLKLFINANPNIENPDRVAVGQIISLPAIPLEVTIGGNRVSWLKVNETDTLEAAFKILRNHHDGYPSLRLIPYWNPADGFKFAVILSQLFKNEKSARSRQEQLPAELSSGSTILSRWDKKTVFFANPYFDRAP
jgi:hypothetical protein